MYFVFYTHVWFVVFIFFFFKQKTAYEMRISDWSSDVCSSDLLWSGRPRWGRPDRLHQKTSNRPAAPWPPPMHMVTTAYLTPRRLPSMRAWPTQRAPVMPKGWPIEIKPPLTLSSSFGMPSGSRSEEHTSELQSLMRISSAVLCFI